MNTHNDELAVWAIAGAGLEIEHLSRKILSRHGLTSTQFHVLRSLVDAEDGLSRAEIAEGLRFDRSDVTRLVDRLQASRLVSRSRSPSDGRVTLHRITARGKRLIARLEPELERLYDGIRELLGDPTIELMNAGSLRLIAAVREGLLRTDGLSEDADLSVSGSGDPDALPIGVDGSVRRRGEASSSKRKKKKQGGGGKTQKPGGKQKKAKKKAKKKKKAGKDKAKKKHKKAK